MNVWTLASIYTLWALGIASTNPRRPPKRWQKITSKLISQRIFDKQTKLSAENIIFQDPTARVFGTDAGQPIVGRDTLIQRRKHTFSKVTDFDLEVEQSFVANPERVKQLVPLFV